VRSEIIDRELIVFDSINVNELSVIFGGYWNFVLKIEITYDAIFNVYMGTADISSQDGGTID
jgi:hypothetical protein